jgi:nickel/cobalt exporter
VTGFSELNLLLVSAAVIGVVHTALGPDHYLPFVAMSRARRWSLRKTAWVASLCGVGHVLGSVVLGLLGVALGISLSKLESFEAARGSMAGWMLLGFGLAFFVWGLFRAHRSRPHVHPHVHADGTEHNHVHPHAGGHLHAHAASADGRANITPWILFTIFLFGPCEILIPLLMYPAATLGMPSVGWVALVFGVATIATMNIIILGTCKGLAWIRWPWLARYGEAVAGLVVLLSGMAVVLGL